MTRDDIKTALILRAQTVVDGLGLTPVLPGFDREPGAGQVLFDFAEMDDRGGTIKGNANVQTFGTMIITICTTLNEGTALNTSHADAIAAVYPEGDRFSITGGAILIRMVPQKAEPYPDTAVLRGTVRVRFVAYPA
jgi:hypothetical protein